MINATLEDRKDRYIDAAPRVGPDNKSIRPHKVACVVVCVGRAEHLKLTLEHNARLVDEMVVVTASDDQATIDVVSSVPGARLVISDSYKNGEAAFNKGAMINAGLASLTNPDWVALSDADCFLNEAMPEYMATHSINPGVLYGSYRADR